MWSRTTSSPVTRMPSLALPLPTRTLDTLTLLPDTTKLSTCTLLRVWPLDSVVTELCGRFDAAPVLDPSGLMLQAPEPDGGGVELDAVGGLVAEEVVVDGLAVVVTAGGVVVDLVVVDDVEDEVVVVVVVAAVVDDDVVVRGDLGSPPHLRHQPRDQESAPRTSVGHFQATATASCPEPSDEPLAAVIAPSKESAALMTTTPVATIANGARRARLA
jgi:hypothetical protein